jgi:hypothetical protein
MVIGNGDIAKALKEWHVDKKGVTFFASGVSNRKILDEDECQREMALLRKYSFKDTHLVYFSSLSIYYSQSMYTMHKIAMEKRVKHLFKRFTIVRIGNISWGDNPNTLLNFLKDKIRKKEIPEIQNVYRYIVSKEEFIHWVRMIPVGIKNEMNIPGLTFYVPDLYKQLFDEINGN